MKTLLRAVIEPVASARTFVRGHAEAPSALPARAASPLAPRPQPRASRSTRHKKGTQALQAGMRNHTPETGRIRPAATSLARATRALSPYQPNIHFNIGKPRDAIASIPADPITDRRHSGFVSVDRHTIII